MNAAVIMSFQQQYIPILVGFSSVCSSAGVDSERHGAW